MTRRPLLAMLCAIGLAPRLSNAQGPAAGAPKIDPLHLSDAQWKQRLTPDQYAVMRQEGTERPYTSPLNDEHRPGVFHCVACDLALFSSTTTTVANQNLWIDRIENFPKATNGLGFNAN